MGGGGDRYPDPEGQAEIERRRRQREEAERRAQEEEARRNRERQNNANQTVSLTDEEEDVLGDRFSEYMFAQSTLSIQRNIIAEPNHGRYRNVQKSLNTHLSTDDGTREITFQRPYRTLDPINEYYALGGDPYQRMLNISPPATNTEMSIIETAHLARFRRNVVDQASSGRYSTSQLGDESGDLASLSYSPEGSEIINWSYGGYAAIGNLNQNEEVANRRGLLPDRTEPIPGKPCYPRVFGLSDGDNRRNQLITYEDATREAPVNSFRQRAVAPNQVEEFQLIVEAPETIDNIQEQGFSFPFTLNQTFNMATAMEGLWDDTVLLPGAPALMSRFFAFQKPYATIVASSDAYGGWFNVDPSPEVPSPVRHHVPWNPAALAMIHAAGLTVNSENVGSPRGFLNWGAQGRMYDIDERAKYDKIANPAYTRNDQTEKSIIRRTQNYRGAIQYFQVMGGPRPPRFNDYWTLEAVTERLTAIFNEDSAFLRPTATCRDVYNRILRIKGDTEENPLPDLRERLEHVWLSYLDELATGNLQASTWVRGGDENWVGMPPGIRYTTTDGEGNTRTRTLRSLQAISSASYRDYDWFDFEIAAPWVSSANLRQNLSAAGNPQRFGRTEQAFVSPVYNFYNKTYESALSNPLIDEKVLPNMYIYQNHSQGERWQRMNRPPWSSTPQNDEEREEDDIYGEQDKLITLGEFTKITAPALADPGDSPEKREQHERFVRYLERIAQINQNNAQEISFEFQSALAEKYYNTAPAGSSLRIFEDFNPKKRSFPMYIEIGMPLAPPGAIGQALGSVYRSAALSNTYIDMKDDAESLPFNLQTQKLTVQNSQVTQIPITSLDQNLKVFEIEDYFNKLKSNALDAARGGRNPRNVKAYGQLETRRLGFGQTTDALKNALYGWAKGEVVKYGEFTKATHKFCKTSETILYKLTKYRVSDGVEELQNFYFPNATTTLGWIDLRNQRPPDGSKDMGFTQDAPPQDNTLPELLRFVDTQVKYNTNYRYELRAVQAVVGSRFRFRRRLRDVSGTPKINKVFYSFNVETLPLIKMVEIPILVRETFAQAFEQGLESDVNSTFYPDVYIVDRPPMDPALQIYPYRSDPNRVLILPITQGGEALADRAKEPLPFTPEQKEQADNFIQRQNTVLSYFVPPGKVEFKNEGEEEVRKIYIYRTQEITQNPVDQTELYSAFYDAPPHRILNLDSGEEEGNSVQSFDMIDDIQPNQKYYYTAKSVDNHGQFSPPSQILEVEMVSDKGLFIPRIGIYDPPPPSPRTFKKDLTRFLEISAADIQKLPIQEITNDGKVSYSARSLVDDQAIGSLVDEEDEAAKKFIVRLTSKDTGRKVDLVVNFKIKTVPQS